MFSRHRLQRHNRDDNLPLLHGDSVMEEAVIRFGSRAQAEVDATFDEEDVAHAPIPSHLLPPELHGDEYKTSEDYYRAIHLHNAVLRHVRIEDGNAGKPRWKHDKRPMHQGL